MEFDVFHAYNRLVRRGLVDPLTCPNDGKELALMGKRLMETDSVYDYTPALKCFYCGTLTEPGLALYNRIKDETERF